MNNFLPVLKPFLGRIILMLISSVVFVFLLFLFLKPTISSAADRLIPRGTTGENVSLWLPDGAVKVVPPLATADYVVESNLSPKIAFPPDVVGPAISFALWQDGGVSIPQFIPSIVVSIKYQDSDIPTSVSDEGSLRLYMYNPASRSWIKLCSSVNVGANVVSAALSFATPFEKDGSSLLAIAPDSTPPLDQMVDSKGTTISIKGSNLRLVVPNEAIELGSYFEITVLPTPAGSRSVKFLARPVDIKLCKVNWAKLDEDNRQITQFAKPLKVGFTSDPDTLSRAGGQTNLTLVNFQEGDWVDLDTVGARVMRGSDGLAVNVRDLGMFGLAAR